MGRLLFGIIKGGLVGVGLGYLAGQLHLATGPMAILVYGVIGAVAGLVCGRALWRQETAWTPILKALFGFALGVGAAFAGRKWLGGVRLPLSFIPGSGDHPLPEVPMLFGPAVGILYGMLVEVDDGSSSAAARSRS